jgi:lysophospholipase L1-like esterase
MRRFSFWLALIAVSGVVLIAGLEFFLQAGAWLVRATGREAPVAWLSDDVRVLCLGDSNTYGLYLEPHESWPAQLEAHWNETVAAPKIRVFNLGYPGTNSSKVAGELTRMLETFRPDFTIVMVGTNDFWTRPVEVAPETDPGRGLARFAERHSRLYRLAFMFARARDADELIVPRVPRGGEGRGERQGGSWEVSEEATFGNQTFELGFSRRTTDVGGRTHAAMRNNLEEIVRRGREGGTELVLMTYPAQEESGFYVTASRKIRRIAERTRTPLIDLERTFATRCPDLACREFLFRDRHPKAAGYEIVAEEASAKLRELLAGSRKER